PITCDLYPTPLDAASPYETLSYTWGDSSSPIPIHISGHVIQVTRNLHAALQHIRQESTDRILWIDALCIDQTNNAEKSAQVQMMRNIYHSAARTLVWLG
ncbi:hypothetical protein K402DRAFT_297997, partial [Aulographum hederae CBS 113979]